MLLLRIAYDGTDLHGCPPVPGHRTVCGEIAAALGRAGATPTWIDPLSRTDAGVHARGNVVCVAPGRPLAPGEALRLLDHHLPPDVRCLAAARADTAPTAGEKTYAYTLDLGRWGDPALARTAWRPGRPLDRAALVDAAIPLVGVRDFAAFHRSDDPRAPRLRAIGSASWSLEADVATFTVRGDGFGYRLVRGLVGGMIAVARGACPAAAWDTALAGHPTHASQQTAPARGLCLVNLDVDADWTAD